MGARGGAEDALAREQVAPQPRAPRSGAVLAGLRQMVSVALAQGPRVEGSDGQETLSSTS